MTNRSPSAWSSTTAEALPASMRNEALTTRMFSGKRRIPEDDYFLKVVFASQPGTGSPPDRTGKRKCSTAFSRRKARKDPPRCTSGVILGLNELHKSKLSPQSAKRRPMVTDGGGENHNRYNHGGLQKMVEESGRPDLLDSASPPIRPISRCCTGCIRNSPAGARSPRVRETCPTSLPQVALELRNRYVLKLLRHRHPPRRQNAQPPRPAHPPTRDASPEESVVATHVSRAGK